MHTHIILNKHKIAKYKRGLKINNLQHRVLSIIIQFANNIKYYKLITCNYWKFIKNFMESHKMHLYVYSLNRRIVISQKPMVYFIAIMSCILLLPFGSLFHITEYIKYKLTNQHRSNLYYPLFNEP